MARENLNDLSAFVAVAQAHSFTKAAAQLGISPSALSHAMRGLEERLGVRLLARTTRSVALTDAGENLLRRVRPAGSELGDAVGQVSRRGPVAGHAAAEHAQEVGDAGALQRCRWAAWRGTGPVLMVRS